VDQPQRLSHGENDEFATAAATNAGMPSPGACLLHLARVKLELTSLNSQGPGAQAGDETAGDEDGADPPPGSTVDAFRFNVSLSLSSRVRVQTGVAWPTLLGLGTTSSPY
jgi:hypothetical protein